MTDRTKRSGGWGQVVVKGQRSRSRHFKVIIIRDAGNADDQDTHATLGTVHNAGRDVHEGTLFTGYSVPSTWTEPSPSST